MLLPDTLTLHSERGHHSLATAELYLTIAAIFGDFRSEATGRPFEIELYESRDDDMDIVADSFVSKVKAENGIRVLVKDRVC